MPFRASRSKMPTRIRLQLILICWKRKLRKNDVRSLGGVIAIFTIFRDFCRSPRFSPLGNDAKMRSFFGLLQRFLGRVIKKCDFFVRLIVDGSTEKPGSIFMWNGVFIF